jgi:hypothetical protein
MLAVSYSVFAIAEPLCSATPRLWLCAQAAKLFCANLPVGRPGSPRGAPSVARAIRSSASLNVRRDKFGVLQLSQDMYCTR